MMSESTPVTLILDAENIHYRLFRHPGPVHSVEQAARERGQRPEQVVRSILFRVVEGEYVMVLLAGPGQLSWSALRRFLGRSRVTLANEEEVLKITGYQLGSVSPFGIPADIRILVDESVFAEEELSIGSGERGTTVILKTQDLIHALSNPEIGQFR